MQSKMENNTPLLSHVHESRVIYGDTDSGGVVYYGNYLRYFEEARTEFMRKMGLTYKDLEEQGFILPVVECYSRYKASAKYDDLILIKTRLTGVKKVSCRFDYRITRKSDDRLLVKGHTLHAVVNREGKLTKMPNQVYEQLLKVIS